MQNIPITRPHVPMCWRPRSTKNARASRAQQAQAHLRLPSRAQAPAWWGKRYPLQSACPRYCAWKAAPRMVRNKSESIRPNAQIDTLPPANAFNVCFSGIDEKKLKNITTYFAQLELINHKTPTTPTLTYPTRNMEATYLPKLLAGLHEAVDGAEYFLNFAFNDEQLKQDSVTYLAELCRDMLIAVGY